MVITLLASISACVIAVASSEKTVLCVWLVAIFVVVALCVTQRVCTALTYRGLSVVCRCARLGMPLRVVVCFILSLSVAEYQLQRLFSAQLPPELEGKSLNVFGTIASVPARDGGIVRFNVDVSEIRTDVGPGQSEPVQAALAGRLRLSWNSDVELALGQQWRFQVRLKRPRGMVNPQGFDYQAWLLRQRFSASGYVLEAEPIAAHTKASWYAINTAILGSLMNMRAQLSARLDQHFFHPSSTMQNGAIIKALLVGDKQAISTAQWQLFQQTGTIHLMAISGLHIGMVAGTILLLMRWLTRPLSLVMGPVSRKVLCVIAALIAAFIYSALAGFSLPTLRAFVCLMIMALAYVFGYRPSFLSVLLGLALCILLLNPMYATQVGFCLSFSAVAALIYTFAASVKLPNVIDVKAQLLSGAVPENQVERKSQGAAVGMLLLSWLQRLPVFIYAQWVMLVALLPCMLLFNLPISVLSPLANSIAIPVFSVLILPILLLSLVGFGLGLDAAEIGFVFADQLLTLLLVFLETIQQPSFILPAASHVGNGVLFALVVAALLLLSPRALGLRGPGAFIALLLMHWVYGGSTSSTAVPRFSMTVLDVGQGLSIAGKYSAGQAGATPLLADRAATGAWIEQETDNSGIQEKSWRFVFDIGAKYSEKFSIAERVVLPHMRNHPIGKPYTLIISHADNDHAGAFDRFVALSPPQYLYSGEPAKLGVSANHQCQQGTLFHYAVKSDTNHAPAANHTVGTDFKVKVLWPEQNDQHTVHQTETNSQYQTGYRSRFKHKANNQSCVVLISFAKHTILLTGDIEVEVERLLLAKGVMPKNIDVLIAPHHGSATSSSVLWLKHIRPKHVIFSAGYKNRYRHPAQKVVERYRQMGTTQWRTAEHGAISVVIEGDQLHIQAERCVQARRWFLNEGFCRS